MTHTKQSILALLERALQTSAKPEVIERLRWFAHFTEHGSVSKTCNKFSIARTTFYRWYNRLDAKNLSTLENIPKSGLLKESSYSNHNCLLCSLRQKLTHKPTAFFALVAALINISIFFLIALPQVAGAASSWAPTLIVNTEAFQIIDDTDSAADLYLQFGGSLNKRLTYDRTLASFIFDDDLEVIGTISGSTIHAQDTLTSSGTLVFEGAASGSSLYLGNKLEGAGLSDCDTASTSKLLWDATTGRFSCGTDTDTDTNTNQLTTFTLSGDGGSDQTISQGNTLEIAGGDEITTTASTTDTVTVNITDDTVDFTELQDTLDLDASTTLNFGGSNFIYDLTSTGDFMIRDNGAAAFFVGDNGHIGMGTEDLVSGIEFELAATDTLVDMYFKRIDSTISNGTGLGFIRFTGTDGGSESAPLIGAGIQGQAAGTWATGNSPANLIFSTTPDSSSTLTERMRIRPSGFIGMGTTSPDTELEVIGTISGATIHAQDQLSASGTTIIENAVAGATTLRLDQDTTGGISIDIDSEATTADIINISASALTTGKSIDIGDADSATTGTGLIFTGISNSSDTSKRSLFFMKNDHASADSTTVMHLQQDGAATTFLADTDGNGIAIDVDSEATSEPGLRISMPTPNASENPHILFGYENIFDTNLFRDTYNSLTTSGSLAVDPVGFNGVQLYDGASYTDNLTEARTTGGTAFTVFAAENPSNDLFYVGMDDPFYTIYFDLAVAGAGITFEVEYWNGSAWTVIGYRDTTSNLTQDGTVTFVNPHNWATTDFLAEGVNKYWVRLNPAGDNITTAPTAYSVSPTTDYRFKVFSNAADTQPTLFVANDQKVGIKTSLPDTELEVVGVISGSTLHSTDLLSGSGYAVFRNVIDSTTAFQINDKDGGAPVFNVDTTNERIGIRNASPISALHIESDVVTIDRLTGQKAFIQLRDNSDSDAGFLYIGGDNTDGAFINGGGTPDKISFKANGTTKMSIGTAGVNIGTGTPNDALDVEGDIDTTGCFQADDTTTIGGTCLSDARLKENIVPLQGMLGKVELLNPVQFDWKAGAPEHGTTVGLIAQELEQVFPHLVSDHEDGFKKIRYDIEMQMVVLAALKELAANVRTSEIDILSFGSSLGETMGLFASRLTNLEKRVEDIENQLPELGENGDLQTISGGQISIGGTFYLIDTENSDDTDVLAKLDGGTVNQILVLQGFDEEHEITVRKTKSLMLKGDYSIAGPDDVLVLLKVTDTKWIELSRTGK